MIHATRLTLRHDAVLGYQDVSNAVSTVFLKIKKPKI